MTQVLAWITIFVVMMVVLEHGVFARLEGRAFAWQTSPASFTARVARSSNCATMF